MINGKSIPGSLVQQPKVIDASLFFFFCLSRIEEARGKQIKPREPEVHLQLENHLVKDKKVNQECYSKLKLMTTCKSILLVP